MADDAKTTGLTQSEKGRKNLQTLTTALLNRQVKDGERKGSFHPTRQGTFYFDYTASLALLAAYENPDTPEEIKKRCLPAVKEWLAHTYREQNEDGTIRPFGPPAQKEAVLEASSGALWVAARYQKAIRGHPDKKELAVISDTDAGVLDKLMERSVKALKKYQREDGLIGNSATADPAVAQVAYYTSNAHAHAALCAAMKACPADSELHKECKAVETRLVAGLKAFAKTDAVHIPFHKTAVTREGFRQWKGHDVLVDAYSGALEGKNKYVETLKAEFEKTMNDPVAKRAFFTKQTVPSSVPMGLLAAGYQTIKIGDKEVPLSEVMDDQLALLAPMARADYVHKVATACMVGYEGCAWMPPLEEKKPAAPAVDKKQEAAIKEAKELFDQAITAIPVGDIKAFIDRVSKGLQSMPMQPKKEPESPQPKR